jgi:hypothetical protein
MAPKRKTALERWGYEFARAREAAGYTSQVSFAKHKDVHVSASLIAHWETGRATPKGKDLEDCEKVLGTNGYLKRLLDNWVSLEVSPEWLEWIGIEEDADTILSFEPSYMPGLLQTEDYARTVLSHDRYSPIDLDERLRSRLKRQQIIDRDQPPTTVFIIGEAALHCQVGTRETMYDQILHLIKLARYPEVIIQIIPSDVGYHAGLTGAFVIARLNGREMAFQDGIWSGQILEGNVEVSTLAKIWQHILAKALTDEASIELLERVADSWKT